MADDAIDPLRPVPPKTPVQPSEEQPRPEPRQRGPVIKGRIVAVTAGHPHDGEPHLLDVTVGGSAYTEILVRVPNGDHGHLEGHDVTLHVDP